MEELGINPEDKDKTNETKLSINENTDIEDMKVTSTDDNTKLLEDDTTDEDVAESIESVPFISEPVKKKRTRSPK